MYDIMVIIVFTLVLHKYHTITRKIHSINFSLYLDVIYNYILIALKSKAPLLCYITYFDMCSSYKNNNDHLNDLTEIAGIFPFWFTSIYRI